VFPEDTGRYTVVAKNLFGTASSSADLSVRDNETLRATTGEATGSAESQVPSVLTKLRTQIIDEGDTATFECQFASPTPPEIIWCRDGKVVKSGHRFQIDMAVDGKTFWSRLIVLDAHPSDSGKYSVTAANTSGDVSMVASLVVQELSKTLDFKAGLRKVEMLPIERPIMEDIAEEEEEKSLHLLQPPADIDAVEGETVEFICRLSPFTAPPPSVSWYFDTVHLLVHGDGPQMAAGDKYRLDIVDDGQVSLTIADVRLDDAGVYTMCASSSAGTVEVSAILMVHVTTASTGTASLLQSVPAEYKDADTTETKTAEASTLPRFEQPLGHASPVMMTMKSEKAPLSDGHLITIEVGQPLSLSCHVSSVEKFDIHWTRNGIKLKNDGHCLLTFSEEDGVASLFITESTISDAGKYTVGVVTNSDGSSISEAEIQVLVTLKPSVFTNGVSVVDQTMVISEPPVMGCTTSVCDLLGPKVGWLFDDGDAVTEKCEQYHVKLNDLTSSPSILVDVMPDNDVRIPHECRTFNMAGEAVGIVLPGWCTASSHAQHVCHLDLACATSLPLRHSRCVG
jgi:hypothetical protein